MKSIMLVMTNNCNLDCTYCYEEKNTAADMTFQMAGEIIDREFAGSPEKSFLIFFFGGEPLLRFDLIRETYDYIEKTYGDYNVHYSVTTNGTLLRGEILSWFKECKDDFDMIVSYDGTPQMQDKNRVDRNGCGSSKQILLEEIIDAFPHAVAKMTIGEDSFANFAEGIQFLSEKGFAVKANFASGVDFGLPDNMPILKKNMLQLTEYYSEKEECRLPFFLDLNLASILIDKEIPFSYCDAGVNKRCFDYKGDCYPCQGLMPMATGNQIFKNEMFPENNILEHSACGACEFVRICRTCYAANYKETGNIWQPSGQTCFLNKVCMLSGVRIQYNRLCKKGREEWNCHDNQVMNAILKIAKSLNGII